MCLIFICFNSVIATSAFGSLTCQKLGYNRTNTYRKGILKKLKNQIFYQYKCTQITIFMFFTNNTNKQASQYRRLVTNCKQKNYSFILGNSKP